MTNRKKIKELEERNLFLSCDNLRMREDLDILSQSTESLVAKKVIEKYRLKAPREMMQNLN